MYNSELDALRDTDPGAYRAITGTQRPERRNLELRVIGLDRVDRDQLEDWELMQLLDLDDGLRDDLT